VDREVEKAIARGIVKRRALLRGLDDTQRERLLEDLFLDFFARQHLLLQKWGALTGQSAQVDTGYIAQFIASILLQEPGQGFRGKGDDLADGSEVKGAANISGVDRPRWNHNMGKPADDIKRRADGLPTASEVYLASPYVFYLLVDRPVAKTRPLPIRIRGWCLSGKDPAWRDLVGRFVDGRIEAQYNLQLHPPVGYDDDVVVNTLGNLDFANVKCLEAWLDLRDPLCPIIDWKLQPVPQGKLGQGRTTALPYTKGFHPSRLTDAADIVADLAVVPVLFGDILRSGEDATLVETTSEEVEADTDLTR